MVDSPQRLRRFDPNGTLLASIAIPASIQPQTVTYVPGTGETVITELDNDQLICLDGSFSLVNTLGSGVTGIASAQQQVQLVDG